MVKSACCPAAEQLSARPQHSARRDHQQSSHGRKSQIAYGKRHPRAPRSRGFPADGLCRRRERFINRIRLSDAPLSFRPRRHLGDPRRYALAQECLQSWGGECPHATPCVCLSVARSVSCTHVAQHCISAPRRTRVSPPQLQCLARSLSQSLSVTLNLSPCHSLSLSLCRSLCLSSSRSVPLSLSFICAIMSLWPLL